MHLRTISLPADLVDRFEALANQQGRSLDELLAELLNSYLPATSGNWALNVAEGMEVADIEWIDDLDASVHSRELFKRHLDEKWQNRLDTGSSDA